MAGQNDTRQTVADNCGTRRRGPTSYTMQDPDVVFGELDLKAGSIFLDLGCGPGDYSIHAAQLVGSAGRVIAVDRDALMTREVENKAQDRGLVNIQTLVQNIMEPLQLGDSSVDVCLISTVMYCLSLEKHVSRLSRDIHRVLKSAGQFAVLECKKEETNFGPPLHIRISAEDVEAVVSRYGFERVGYEDLGFNYLVRFIKK
ncbi:MAG: class I SAM-dependent methyltransferase [Pseudodesulfovibrio sp.]|nr:class I SAM-dependent methyltransferase [Pseudodesulfovibrio sp.]